MTPVVELREWETREIELTDEGARQLATLAGPRLGIGVGSQPGHWSVAATSHVGTFVTPEVELLIRPKVPMHNLFQMLDVGLRTATFERSTFAFGADRSLLGAIAELYARAVERAIGTGLVRSYRAEHDRLLAIRGRIDVASIVRRGGLPTPVPCAFEEYTADIVENRALKGALRRLLRVPGVRPRARRSLTHTLARFEEVSDQSVEPAVIDRLVYNRLNRHYREPLRLASLILRNLSLIDRVGTDDASAFTVDMNVVFQDWVTDRLQQHLRGRLRVGSEPAEHLGVKQRVVMYPDLVFHAGDELVYVGDVKYKITGSGLARNADYYQLLAYATALGLEEGVLIYCQAEGAVPEQEIMVRNAGTRLRTYAVDLRGSPTDAEAAVEGLAHGLMGRTAARALTLPVTG